MSRVFQPGSPDDPEEAWGELDEYDARHEGATQWALAYPEVERHLPPLAEKTVLDYGCGAGAFARRLASQGALTVGVDTSARAIAVARTRPPLPSAEHRMPARFCVIDGADLSPLGELRLDAAVLNLLLCSMAGEDDVAELLQALRDRLEPGAPLILCEPHPDALGVEYVSMVRRSAGAPRTGAPVWVRYPGGRREPMEYWRSQADYVRLLEQAGLALERVSAPILHAAARASHWRGETHTPPFLILVARRPHWLH